MIFLSVDKYGVVKSVSDLAIKQTNTSTIETAQLDGVDKLALIGKHVRFGLPKEANKLRVAVICNWADRCGISTYSSAILDALRDMVGEIRIFSDMSGDSTFDKENNVVRCWKRGESMRAAVREVLEWSPDIVHVQHEFGLFPKATHFLKMLELLDGVPYVITLHSVYEHLDKTICTAHIKNVIVHSKTAMNVLRQLGHLNGIYQVTHGCVTYEQILELWNIFQNDYSIVQFGFGFGYKGVDMAIDAIKYLKENDPKFKDIFYCYLCSENPSTRNTHNEYYNYLHDRVEASGLEDNVTILRGFLSDSIIRNFLCTAKLAIFPYKTDANNLVYGASGAIRHAMANGIPIVASDSHMFDDLDGVVPRAEDAISLAKEIDRIFSDTEYRKALVQANLSFLRQNTWDAAADRHVEVYLDILKRFDAETVWLQDYRIL